MSELVPLLLPWDVEELAACGIAAELWEALIRAATQVQGDRQRAAEDDALPEDLSEGGGGDTSDGCASRFGRRPSARIRSSASSRRPQLPCGVCSIACGGRF